MSNYKPNFQSFLKYCPEIPACAAALALGGVIAAFQSYFPETRLDITLDRIIKHAESVPVLYPVLQATASNKLATLFCGIATYFGIEVYNRSKSISRIQEKNKKLEEEIDYVRSEQVSLSILQAALKVPSDKIDKTSGTSLEEKTSCKEYETALDILAAMVEKTSISSEQYPAEVIAAIYKERLPESILYALKKKLDEKGIPYDTETITIMINGAKKTLRKPLKLKAIEEGIISEKYEEASSMLERFSPLTKKICITHLKNKFSEEILRRLNIG